MGSWFVYIARCADDSVYIGIARDVRARVAAHDAGRGARYTRGRGPLDVLATRRCATQGNALRLEAALKRLAHGKRLEVAASKDKLASLAKSVREAARQRSSSRTKRGGGTRKTSS